MYVAFIITYSDCYISHFAEVKMRVILVIVRCDPAHPHATRLLARKHSHRIIVLVKEGCGRERNISTGAGEDKIQILTDELNKKNNISQVAYTVILANCAWIYMVLNIIFKNHTVVVLRIMSMSSLSSGTTSSTKRGIVGTTGGGLIKAAFLALNRNL